MIGCIRQHSYNKMHLQEMLYFARPNKAAQCGNLKMNRAYNVDSLFVYLKI